MKINFNKVGFWVSSVFFIAFFSFIGFIYMSNGEKTESGFLLVAASGETIINIEKKETNNNNSVENKENTVVAAASDAVVKGKVIEKYLSPYTANTSYKNVYLKNNTELNIDIKNLLESGLSFSIEKNNKPQVLILHTHATETFLREKRNYYSESDKTRTTDENYNMIALGSIVAEKLNSNGIKTIHSKIKHDYPSYNQSYSNAAETICNTLNKNPSVKVVIDLHRDSICTNENDKVKLTKKINGKDAAQIMIVMGSQSGNVKNFPDYLENLKLAVKLQEKIETMYSGLARSILLMSKNYNESLSKGSLLIEIGTDANSLDEVKYSAELLSNSLIALLNEL